MTYASVLLPLAAPGTFTYAVPPSLAQRGLSVGQRVIVQFGARRYYTGVVTELLSEKPASIENVKEITETLEDAPLVLPWQLDFWQWIAQYYMCTQGEVMKAALPAGLKLESETRLLLSEDFDFEGVENSPTLTSGEKLLLSRLDANKGRTLLEIQKKIAGSVSLCSVKHLLEIGAIRVEESLVRRFRPKTELHVRLSENFADEEKLNALFDALRRAPAQETLLLRYLELANASAALTLKNLQLLAEVSRRELLSASPQSAAALTALRKRGVLETYDFEVQPQANEATKDDRARLAAYLKQKPLGKQQARALEEVKTAFHTRDVCLLHGVTSSGKTEVYIHLISQALARGEQVLYLLPEIALTTQITNRLRRVFGKQMGVYHSKFTDAQRVVLWQRQLVPAEAHPLILGVRSALFLPFQHLGLIIVDEEHETSYKQTDPAPRYEARDAAIVLGKKLGAKVLLGTATPSLETFHNAQEGKYALVSMPERYGGVQLPQIIIENVSELKRKKEMKSPFSPRLIEEVRGALERGEQAIIFQNRRGWAPVLRCRDCGWTPTCTKCDVSLTYHQYPGRLVCHYCGTTYDLPQQCPACGKKNLHDMGYGTERIEDEAQRLFPTAKIARMDLDTTRTQRNYEEIITNFAQRKTNLLIGTQMITKGLDFGSVSVVGILSADQLLSRPDFRAHERAFHLMMQVAGRAGRRGKRGLVILQTSQPDLPLIQQVLHGDYEGMYALQMQERRDFRFPPFVRLINIILKHRSEAVVDHAASELASLLRPHFGDNLLGPDRPVVARIGLLYIRHLLVKVENNLPTLGVRRTLLAARSVLTSRAAFKSVQMNFDVDP